MKKLLLLLLFLLSSSIIVYAQNGYIDGVSCINNKISIGGWSRNSSGNFESVNVFVDGVLAKTVTTSNFQRPDVVTAFGGGSQDVGFNTDLDICYSNGQNRTIVVRYVSNNSILSSSNVPIVANCSGGSGSCGGCTTAPSSPTVSGGGNICSI